MQTDTIKSYCPLVEHKQSHRTSTSKKDIAQHRIPNILISLREWLLLPYQGQLYPCCCVPSLWIDLKYSIIELPLLSSNTQFRSNLCFSIPSPKFLNQSPSSLIDLSNILLLRYPTFLHGVYSYSLQWIQVKLLLVQIYLWSSPEENWPHLFI